MKCKYCGKSPAYKPTAANKTYVCIKCMYDNKKYHKDFENATRKRMKDVAIPSFDLVYKGGKNVRRKKI